MNEHLVTDENVDTFDFSLYELRFYTVIRGLIPKAQCYYAIRPDWLTNPKTGQNLEVDFYFPNFKLGFEIQGEYHFGEKSERQQERDFQKYIINGNKQIIEVFPQTIDALEGYPLETFLELLNNNKDRLTRKQYGHVKDHVISNYKGNLRDDFMSLIITDFERAIGSRRWFLNPTVTLDGKAATIMDEWYMSKRTRRKLKKVRSYWRHIHKKDLGRNCPEKTSDIRDRMYKRFAERYGRFLLNMAEMLEILYDEKEKK